MAESGMQEVCVGVESVVFGVAAVGEREGVREGWEVSG